MITVPAASKGKQPVIDNTTGTTTNTASGTINMNGGVPKQTVVEHSSCCGLFSTKVTTVFTEIEELVEKAGPVLQGMGKAAAPMLRAVVTTELSNLQNHLQNHVAELAGGNKAVATVLNGMVAGMVAGAQAASTDVINGTVNATSVDQLKATLTVAAHAIGAGAANATVAGIDLRVNLAESQLSGIGGSSQAGKELAGIANATLADIGATASSNLHELAGSSSTAMPMLGAAAESYAIVEGSVAPVAI